MIPSSACFDLAKRFESLRCSAYLDPVGIPTIGYGHTKNVHIGDSCTPEQADTWIQEDMHYAAQQLDPYLTSTLVLLKLTQPQYDALLDALFNIGPGCPAGLHGGYAGRDGIIWLAQRDAQNLPRHSTLFRCLLSGDHQGAADEFPKWCHDAKGNVEPGLVARRAAERDLFLSGTVKT